MARRWLVDPVRWRILEQGVRQLADPMTPHSCIDKQAGKVKETAQCRAPAQGNKASNPRLKTPVGVEEPAEKTPSLTGEFVEETHRGLECPQAHPHKNQH